MAGTFTQLNVHIVFGTKNRAYLIGESYREEVEKIMCGMIKYFNCKPLAIFCNPDHVHILIGLKPHVSISDLVRDIKSASSKLINEKKWFRGKFNWQEGYGAFSNSNQEVPRVIQYILDQPKHHAKQNFKVEYLQLLCENDIRFEEKYVFEPVEFYSS